LKWRDVASVKIKLKVPATRYHRRKHPAPAHWRAIANVWFFLDWLHTVFRCHVCVVLNHLWPYVYLSWIW